MKQFLVVLASWFFMLQWKKPVPQDPGKSEPAKLPSLMHPSDPNFRMACNEVAEQLSKSLPFKFQIAVANILVVGALLAIFGWNTSTSLKDKSADFDKKIDAQFTTIEQRLAASNEQVSARIDKQFEDKEIAALVNAAVERQAKDMLQNSVEPAIKQFKADLGTRLDEFKRVMNAAEESANAKLVVMEKQLTMLREREDIMALGEEAAAEGSLAAYKILVDISKDKAASIHRRRIAGAELRSVFAALSTSSRISDIKIEASLINRHKKELSDLVFEDFKAAWPEVQNNALARAKLAQMMVPVLIPKSRSQLEFVVSLIEAEQSLEVLGQLNWAFQKLSGFREPGPLDLSHQLKWWRDHQFGLRPDEPSER